jgi:phospholipase C
MGKIDHVFVLMLENRSFDHFYGLSGLVPPPPAKFGFTPGAIDRLNHDPPHDFDAVAAQVAGGAMTGFPQSGGKDAMKGFDAADIPTLATLAQNYLLMDNWYSSMPGPTWPNRLFAHAGSSGGLDNSMSILGENNAVTDPTFCMQFDKSHIFDRLTGAGKTWRVYQGDRYPQILSLRGMVEASDYNQRKQFFRPFNDLAGDLKRGDAANYTWIEPHYGIYDNFKSGNSQHPLGSVSDGEALVRAVYNSVRASSVWESSVLLVVWDEHGGFFDHSSPPAATPPGDHPWNHGRAHRPRNCKFDTYGPRVPAILISPWLPQGLGSKIFAGKIFDHSSIVASLRDTFALGPGLTNRDKGAPSWMQSVLKAPRTPRIGVIRKKKNDIPSPAVKGSARRNLAVASSHNLFGFSQIACAVDWQVARQTGTAPLATTTHARNLAKALAMVLKSPDSDKATAAANRILLAYMTDVDTKAQAAEASAQRKAQGSQGTREAT